LPTAVRIPPIGQQANSHIFYPDSNLGKDNYSIMRVTNKEGRKVGYKPM
jgi:hypothetical protein